MYPVVVGANMIILCRQRQGNAVHVGHVREGRRPRRRAKGELFGDDGGGGLGREDDRILLLLLVAAVIVVPRIDAFLLLLVAASPETSSSSSPPTAVSATVVSLVVPVPGAAVAADILLAGGTGEDDGMDFLLSFSLFFGILGFDLTGLTTLPPDFFGLALGFVIAGSVGMTAVAAVIVVVVVVSVSTPSGGGGIVAEAFPSFTAIAVDVAGGRRHRRLRRIVDHLRCHRRFIGMAWEDGEGVGERQGGKR